MRKHYDFSNAKRNPYVGKLKKQVTIRLEIPVVDYFKSLAKEIGIPYQNLINLYLRDCALGAKRPLLQWESEVPNKAPAAHALGTRR